MKKALIIGILFSIAFAGCKKEEKEEIQEIQNPIIGKWNYITYSFIDHSGTVYSENPQEEGYSMYFIFNEDNTYYWIDDFLEELTSSVGTYFISDNYLMLYPGTTNASTYTFNINNNVMKLSSKKHSTTVTSILEKVR